MVGCGALVHAMPLPSVMLPCVKGLNPRPSTNHSSQPLPDIGKNAAVLPSRWHYSIAGSIAVLTVPEPAMQ